MSLRERLSGALFIAMLSATAAVTRPASAQESTSCASVDRGNLIACALGASLSLKSEEWATEAAEGRLKAASPWLPSNPVLSVSAARRTEGSSARGDKTWSAELSQQFELAGQRGTRRAVAGAEIEAANHRRRLVMREVATRAWVAYFEALAAKESERAAARLEAAMTAIAAAFRGISEQGLAAGVDADLAQVAALSAQQARRVAERRRLVANIELSTLLGIEPDGIGFDVRGDLLPLPGVDEIAARPPAPDRERPELTFLEAERRALQARTEVFRRARVPNLIVSVFAQREGFAEQVYGVGLAVPVPLPYPIGRTYAGEIAETQALAQQVSTEVRRARRELRGDWAAARAEYLSNREAMQMFTAERTASTERTLRDTAEQVAAGRIAIRDAIFTERTLMEFLQAGVEARRALCLASVELARAAGVALERGGQ